MAYEPGAAALYDDAIKSAARAAVRAGRLPNPHAEATVDNPLCGDRVTLGIRLKQGRIEDLGHRVRGCLLCEAAASLIGEIAPGLDQGSVETALHGLDTLLQGQGEGLEPPWEQMMVFAPVSAFKSRHRCVRLPFEALLAALGQVARGTAAPAPR